MMSISRRHLLKLALKTGALAAVAPTLARLGETERAKEWLERALFLDPDEPIATYNAACTYAQLGEIDRAFDALDKWSQTRGMEMELWLDTDADLDPLRKDLRFVTMLQTIKDERGTRVRGGS